MEILPGITIDINFIVGLMINVSMVLLLVLSLVMVRQESLMEKVVDFSIRRGLRLLTWIFCGLCLSLAVIVILV